jgi:hypothetical protein
MRLRGFVAARSRQGSASGAADGMLSRRAGLAGIRSPTQGSVLRSASGYVNLALPGVEVAGLKAIRGMT